MKLYEQRCEGHCVSDVAAWKIWIGLLDWSVLYWSSPVSVSISNPPPPFHDTQNLWASLMWLHGKYGLDYCQWTGQSSNRLVQSSLSISLCPSFAMLKIFWGPQSWMRKGDPGKILKSTCRDMAFYMSPETVNDEYFWKRWCMAICLATPLNPISFNNY